MEHPSCLHVSKDVNWVDLENLELTWRDFGAAVLRS